MNPAELYHTHNSEQGVVTPCSDKLKIVCNEQHVQSRENNLPLSESEAKILRLGLIGAG